MPEGAGPSWWGGVDGKHQITKKNEKNGKGIWLAGVKSLLETGFMEKTVGGGAVKKNIEEG